MKRVLVLLGFLLALTGCRFHEVERGVLYRGPQPSGEELEKAITTYGLKTVINLRGEAPGESWYDEEKEVVDRLGANLVNIAMSASHLPHKENLIKLLDALKDAPRPILIHCKAGVDRTGEASAIYQMIYMGKTREQALEMLSDKYGHFEDFMPAKRYFIRDVWQGEEWARKEYDPCLGQYQYYDATNSHCQGAKVARDEGGDT